MHRQLGQKTAYQLTVKTFVGPHKFRQIKFQLRSSKKFERAQDQQVKLGDTSNLGFVGR